MIELTPGPNMAWLAGLAAAEGRRSGTAAVAGVALGLLVNALLAALGLALLLETIPMLQKVLRVAGAALMLWLAFDTWRSAASNMHLPERHHSLRRAFATGMMINLLNPKSYLFFLVMVPRFLGGEPLNPVNALTLAATSAAIATTIHFAVVFAASKARAYFSHPRHLVMLRWLLALIMVGVAASFLVSDFGGAAV
ncbi:MULTISPECIES: LysE family translocator [Sphingopyxis]|nr:MULTISPECIES: LysE family translocator [Sphingopyxis]